ncbi:hypothetical protein Acr_21g0011850 [Actinidia rufa]|uniref:Uncharacterized protein n=1 Tax=Actinidia rufa TaxID=165716 RepID=A0A7J0GIE8_9ERIC|nr:hypothetical protein Acr_21g0011850 [Actinidia rufa]
MIITSAIRSWSCCISLARTDVGTATPIAREEEMTCCCLLVCTSSPFPSYFQTRSPSLDSGSLERSELEEEDGWKPQQQRTPWSDRNDCRNVTSLPQSTEVGL